MTCTSWYKLVQACTSPEKFFVKMLMVALGAWKIAVLVMRRSGLLTKMHDGLLTFLPVHSTFLMVGGWWLLGADTLMPMS